MTAHEIIIRPIVSERSFSGMELNKYTFEVAKDANKYQIKDAVEEIFGVKVVRVNTLTVKPKTKRVRYVAGGSSRFWAYLMDTPGTVYTSGVIAPEAEPRIPVCDG